MNPYEILGLAENCTDEEITAAFRALAKEHHPDVGGDTEIFIKVNIAVEILRDPHKRKMYDDFGVCMSFSEDVTREMALGKFRTLVSEWVDLQVSENRDINIQKFFKHRISEAKKKLNQVTNNLELSITALKERMAEITVKDGEPNIVVEVIQMKINNSSTELQNLKMEGHLLSIIENESSKYSSREEMEQSMNSVMHFSSNMYNEEFINRVKAFRGR